MDHLIFEGTSDVSPIAIIVKNTALKYREIDKHYVQPLRDQGFKEKIYVFSVDYDKPKTVTAKYGRAKLQNLVKGLNLLKIKTVLIADAPYFKLAAKATKTENAYGYPKEIHLEEAEDIFCFIIPNYQGLFHNPSLQDRIDFTINAVLGYTCGIYTEPGKNIIHAEYYPRSNQIGDWIGQLYGYESLTCDIETESLDPTSRIGTIAFSWKEGEGVAFPVDWDGESWWDNKALKRSLKEFFIKYSGTLIFHNANFDVKILIYNLFMKGIEDYAGLLEGIDVLYNKFHCTKVIAYLATNSTAGNNLKLKHLAFEYAGDWAQDDIDDITKIPFLNLLRYNLVDALATWYVFNKYYPIMVQDAQLDIYHEIMLDSMRLITNMELVGMPLNMDEVSNAEQLFLSIKDKASNVLKNSKLIKKFEWKRQGELMVAKNSTLKKKVHPIEAFEAEAKFNPGSDKQIQRLLHEVWDYPALDLTKSGAPSVGQETLQKHLNRLIQEYGITEEELNNDLKQKGVSN